MIKNVHHLFLLVAASALLFLTTGCVNEPETEEIANAILTFQLFEEDTGEPLDGVRVVYLSAVQEGETDLSQPFPVQTDEEGRFSGFISNPHEITLTKIIFILQKTNDENETVEITHEKEVQLMLKFEEPYETIDLEIMI